MRSSGVIAGHDGAVVRLARTGAVVFGPPSVVRRDLVAVSQSLDLFRRC